MSVSLPWRKQKRRSRTAFVARAVPAVGLFLLIVLGLAVGCSNGSRKLLESAENRLRQGDYLGAVQNYRTIVEDYSKSPEADDAYFSIGTIEVLYLQDYQGALLTFRSLIRDYPKSPLLPKAQQWIAEIYDQKLHRPQTAIAEYQKLVEMTDDPALRDEIRYRVGETYVTLNDLDQARAEWEELLRDSPSGARADNALYRIGTTFFLEQEYDQALKSYERLVKNYPDSELRAEALAGIAGCYEEMDQPETALEKYREVEPLYPNPGVIQLKIKSLEEKLGIRPGE